MTKQYTETEYHDLMRETINTNMRVQKAINALHLMIDGDSPMDSEISRIIRILEGHRNV